jgi:hypothetical protein
VDVRTDRGSADTPLARDGGRQGPAGREPAVAEMEQQQVKRRARGGYLSRTWSSAVAPWLASLLCLAVVSCGGGGDTIVVPPPAETAGVLEPDEISAIIELAARATPEQVAIAVTDRQARILGVSTNFPIDPDSCKTPVCIPGSADCEAACGTASSDCGTVSLATQLARTAGLFSADQIFLTSRAVRFISDPNFPPGVINTGAGGLFSIEATNRGCQLDAANPNSADFNPGKFYPPQLNVASLLREQDGEAPLLCRRAKARASGRTAAAATPASRPSRAACPSSRTAASSAASASRCAA